MIESLHLRSNREIGPTLVEVLQWGCIQVIDDSQDVLSSSLDDVVVANWRSPKRTISQFVSLKKCERFVLLALLLLTGCY